MDNEIEKNLDYLYVRRERLDHDRYELSNSIDKYLLTISIGTISLMVNSIYRDAKIYIWLFATSIILFLICIISTILSIHFSVSAYQKQVNITDKEICFQLGYSKEICRENNWNYIVKVLSIISSVLFIFAIIAAVLFYVFNLK